MFKLKSPRMPRRVALASCAALAAATLTAPEGLGGTAAAAENTCASSVATYTVPDALGGMRWPLSLPRSLHKYLDWDPQGGGVDGPLWDTEKTATIPAYAVFTTAGNGIFYTFDQKKNTVQSYADKTASGGSLLTPVKTYPNLPIRTKVKNIVSNGDRLLIQSGTGDIAAYQQSSPTTGGGTLTLVGMADSFVEGTSVLGQALVASDDMWMVGSKLYVLKDGAISYYSYSEVTVLNKPVPRLSGPTTVLTGLKNAVHGWSPGPGTIYTTSTGEDYTGYITSYTGSPLAPTTQEEDESRPTLFGDVFTDTATCLAPTDSDRLPYLGSPEADSSDGEWADDNTEPAPASGPNKASGAFTLPNGRPAANFPVTVETDNNAVDDSDGTLTPVATTRTDAAGKWSLELPTPLPDALQKIADNNGGALNLTVTIAGTTASGVNLVGTANMVAAPEDPASGAPTTFALAAAADTSPGTAAMLPAAAPNAPTPKDPSASADQQAAMNARANALEPDAASGDEAPLPQWRSDDGQNAADFNPNIVNGKDISVEAVTPSSNPLTRDSGNCWTVKAKVSHKIAYTTVGEAHAGWDSKASFEYDAKLSGTVETAFSGGGGKWSVSGGRTIGSSMGVTTGYYNRGPYFAKQWKVPLRYTKYKHTYYCGGVARSTHWTISAGRYEVPSGGYVAKYGKDVRYKDTKSKFNKSSKANRAKVAKNSGFTQHVGHSIKWTGAASVYGLTFGATTEYNRDHHQKIIAGGKSGTHWIWGSGGKPGSKNAHLFYSR
ncbi:hypothetical protein [Streptomyces sp. NPDC007088]|uniref:hypothetical protein n=1 Tax=Streptomyces sp. NPDC007088 TaxID=3364773 RepID=UPI0036C01DAD